MFPNSSSGLVGLICIASMGIVSIKGDFFRVSHSGDIMNLKEQNKLNFDEEMVSIGKYLMYFLVALIITFVLIIFTKPEFLTQFTDYTIKIVGLITAGVVVYIVINNNRRRR